MAITLKAARTNKNLTQEEAGRDIGVSKYTIGNWEKGKSFPNANQIRRIEQVYDVSYDDIIFLQQHYT